MTLDEPVQVRLYRARFPPYEATRYLDAEALRSARKAIVECGTITAPGVELPVAAEIRNGRIVALRPTGCSGCGPRRGGGRRGSGSKELMKKVRAECAARGIGTSPVPAQLKISRRLGFQIPIGPVVIIIGDPAPGGIFDVCVEYQVGDFTCWWCLIGRPGCMKLGW